MSGSRHPSLKIDARQAGHVGGFTLIELLIVMAIIATLLSIVAPRYFDSVDRAKEAALRTDLKIFRDSIDKFHTDTGRYPETLQSLVDGRYIQSVPSDPVTDVPNKWLLVPHPDGHTSGIYDVHSGAPGVARDGSTYANW